MAKDVIIHNDNTAGGNLGIVNANHVNLGMFEEVEDPLANVVDNTLAQKAGASIPNMFARMLFFSTAFESTTNINALSTYNSMISQCFDLLEMLFNRNGGINIVPYNFQAQIALLRASQNSRHQELAIRLEDQIAILGNAVQTIYLFEDNNGIVIGGTSPFTMVFTSPNYTFNNPPTPLTNRDAGFRRYVYDMVSSLVAANPLNNMPYEGFAKYVSMLALSNNRDFANDGYTMNNFINDYPDIMMDNQVPISWYDNIALRLRPRNNNFTSDFFVNSPIIQFNSNTTPLVLTNGDHGNMLYYDGQFWQPHFNVLQAERTTPGPRYLPESNDAHQHDFVTDIDFFEERLVIVDYPIDTDHFYCPPVVLDGGRYAMLPLKPFFLHYFEEQDLHNCLNVNVNGNQCTFTLRVPVFNGNNRNNVITITKQYDLNSQRDVFDMTALGQFGVGISPFYSNAGNYWVSSMIDAANYQIRLRFYNHGNEVEQPTTDNQVGSRVSFYNLPQFDFIQIEIHDIQRAVGRCMLLPKFDDRPGNGPLVVAYAVDFGTTNTHIAYYKNNNSYDFTNDDYKRVARYFGKSQWDDQGVTRYADDTLRVLKARQFFPQTTDRLSYDFPIRTALYSSGNQWERLFCDASIGFHYSKEVIQNNSYDTELKWNYLHNIAGAIPRQKVLAYMHEILWMIKCHWEGDPDADHNQVPRIGITYPRDAQILNDWEVAYQNVFGNQANGVFVPMAESLAPCVEILSNNPNIRTQGYVGIDIGGGTTDILYYREVQGNTTSIGDSILFAADDLWGCGYENLGDGLRRANQVNQFTQLAQQQFEQQGAKISINGEVFDINNINKTGKELINILFCDENQSLSRLLSDCNSQSQNIQKGRTRMLIHYSAIVYHLVSWLRSNNVEVPQNIRLSGMGSKYLNMLFNDNQSITAYTSALINAIYGNDNYVQAGFSVELPNNNPKVVTARGAAREAHHAYGLGGPLPNTKSIGVANNNNIQNPLTVNNTFMQVDNAMAFFNDFIEKYQAVNPQVRPNGIATLDNNAIQQFTTNARASIITIQGDLIQRGRGGNRLDESLFIWALKDSVWQI